jgi:hypothetical protein
MDAKKAAKLKELKERLAELKKREPSHCGDRHTYLPQRCRASSMSRSRSWRSRSRSWRRRRRPARCVRSPSSWRGLLHGTAGKVFGGRLILHS